MPTQTVRQFTAKICQVSEALHKMLKSSRLKPLVAAYRRAVKATKRKNATNSRTFTFGFGQIKLAIQKSVSGPKKILQPTLATPAPVSRF